MKFIQVWVQHTNCHAILHIIPYLTTYSLLMLIKQYNETKNTVPKFNYMTLSLIHTHDPPHLGSICLFILKKRSCKSFQVIKTQTRNWTIKIFHKFISYLFWITFIIKLSEKFVYSILENSLLFWLCVKIIFLHICKVTAVLQH